MRGGVRGGMRGGLSRGLSRGADVGAIEQGRGHLRAVDNLGPLVEAAVCKHTEHVVVDAAEGFGWPA